MISVAAFFPNGKYLFMTDSVPLPLSLAGVPLYLLLTFICGGNLGLGTLSYLATNVLPSGRVTHLGVAFFMITLLSFLLIFLKNFFE